MAQQPASPRDSSRLLVLDRTKGSWEHKSFSDLPSLLNEGDLIVANNTKVIRARLTGRRIGHEGEREVQGGKVEFVLLEEESPLVWEGLMHASAKHKPGLRFEVQSSAGQSLIGTIVRGPDAQGIMAVEFNKDPIECGAGEVPLPPYIRRPALPNDELNYQTIYAKELGSAAAPTAGLHFTEKIKTKLVEKKVGWAELTLHIGIGTFRPVKTSDIREHRIHEERFSITRDTAETVTRIKRGGRRIIAVGTTTVRALESTVDGAAGTSIESEMRRTSLFIMPGEFKFQVVDGLLTNFHLPCSTLLVLVCAFAGRDLVMAAYEDAIRNNYRFHSYGDAMLIV